MTITITWTTKIINIPKEDLTLIQMSPSEIREMDLDWFRCQLKAIEASEEGQVFVDLHKHNTEVSLGGLTFARVIEIINDYTITFEDGQYAVNLIGANSNVGDVVNVNQVSVRSQNSAGLTSAPSDQSISSEQIDSIESQIQIIASQVSFIGKMEGGRWKINRSTNQIIFYDEDGLTPIKTFNLKDENGQPSATDTWERDPV